MAIRNSAPDWRGTWADLLQGAGRGLLELDGSPAAQAALVGLNAFETGQERRHHYDEWRRHDFPGEAGERAAEHLQAEIERIYPGLELSAEEWAHLLRLSPAQQRSWLEEMAETDHPDKPQIDDWKWPRSKDIRPIPDHPLPGRLVRSASHRPQPMSANPFDGWATSPALPLGPDGHLTVPALRR